MNLKEEIKLHEGKEFVAQGKAKIELTDPITGKVKEKAEKNNHVFQQTFTRSYIAKMSDCWTVLTDSTRAIDPNMPYVMGEVTGYGIPSTAGTGLYRGAYNAANQVIAEITRHKIRWLYQYNFTSAQINGIPIATIGLTRQYVGSLYERLDDKAGIQPASDLINYTNDGTYVYSCSSGGIVTKTDSLWRSKETIDLSAIVGGTISGVSRAVAYAPMTGRYYIQTVSSNTENRFIYEFSDNTFSTLLNTYVTSNIPGNSTYYSYVYGNYIYYYCATDALYKANFVANTSPVSIVFSRHQRISDSGAYIPYITQNMHIGYKNYIIFGGLYTGFNNTGLIFDMSTDKTVAYLKHGTSQTPPYASAISPYGDFFNIESITKYNSSDVVYAALYSNPATAAVLLDEPIIKTEANGLTMTYEIAFEW